MTAPLLTVALREWETLGPDQDDRLQGRSLSGSSVRVLAELLSESTMLDVRELRNGLEIQTFSHVGRMRFGDIEITILPKLKQSSLLNLLRYAYGFRKLRLFSDSGQQIDRGGFADLLVSQLNAEVTELVARGLHRRYIHKEDRLASPRGRIDIQHIANDGGVATASLPCFYHPRIEDCLLNRVLLAGLNLASLVATDLSLRRTARRLAASFRDRVGEMPLTPDALRRANRQMNRLTVAYEPAVSVIGLLCVSQGISFEGAGAPVKLPGFLFDMNRFFQALVSRFLREHLEGCTLRDEYRLSGMIRYAPGYNPRNHPAPTPRPDFVMLKGTQIVAILDAKYRDLWEKSLPRDMLYQLAIYAASHDKQIATILYPTTDPEARESRLNVHDPAFGRQTAQVRLRPVIMQQLENLLTVRQTAAVQRERRTYAEWLAFGEPN